jgi:hypothetical protein
VFGQFDLMGLIAAHLHGKDLANVALCGLDPRLGENVYPRYKTCIAQYNLVGALHRDGLLSATHSLLAARVLARYMQSTLVPAGVTVNAFRVQSGILCT